MGAGETLPVGSLADIMAADDIHRAGVTVPVPEWGRSVVIRGMTRGEVAGWYDTQGAVESDAFVLAAALVEPRVTLEQALEIIRSKGTQPVRAVLERVMELSGLTDGFREANPDPVSD